MIPEKHALGLRPGGGYRFSKKIMLKTIRDRAGFRMTVLYLEALTGIALSLSILMALAWVVQQRTGNSGWVDTIWTFAVGLVGAASALLPVAGAGLDARRWLG